MSPSVRFFYVANIAISESTKVYKCREKQYYDNKYISLERICGKEMSLDANGRSVKTGMIVHPKGECTMWWLQQLHGNDRRPRVKTVGKTGRGTWCRWANYYYWRRKRTHMNVWNWSIQSLQREWYRSFTRWIYCSSTTSIKFRLSPAKCRWLILPINCSLYDRIYIYI